jgi:hypothetical protein
MKQEEKKQQEEQVLDEENLDNVSGGAIRNHIGL